MGIPGEALDDGFVAEGVFADVVSTPNGRHIPGTAHETRARGFSEAKVACYMCNQFWDEKWMHRACNSGQCTDGMDGKEMSSRVDG